MRRLTRQRLASAVSIALFPLLLAAQTRIVPDTATTFRDIAYRGTTDSAQRLDLYQLPARPTTPFPTVVVLHGGSLTSGDRRDPPTAEICVAERKQTQPPILENAQLFAARMREAGRPVDIEVLPNRAHMSALTMMQDPLDPTFMRVVDFTSRAHR